MSREQLPVEPLDDGPELPTRAGTAAPYRRFKQLLQQLRKSRESGDGRILLLTEEAAALAAVPGQRARVEALLELARIDPWQVCLTVTALVRNAARLQGADLEALVSACVDALEHVPPEDRDDLLEDLARDGYYDFLRCELTLMLERCAQEEVAEQFAASLRRLPPSARARFDVDALLRRCLERLGPAPLSAWLDHLLLTVALRDLVDDGLREAIAATYAGALELSDVQARHRDRLYYLSRYATSEVTRARLLVRHDLARVAVLGNDIADPEVVLEQLVHFPQVLTPLPEREAQGVIGCLLRRLVRRLCDDDHLRIGRTLCDPERPEPFFTAYHAHLSAIAERASDPVRLELWGEFFSAWLSSRSGELGVLMRPLLVMVADGLDRDVRRELGKRLKHQFGLGLTELLSSGTTRPESTWRRWSWPWSSRAQV